jgi:hypothetical protein
MTLPHSFAEPSLSMQATPPDRPASMVRAETSWMQGDVASAIQQGVTALGQIESSCPADELREAFLSVALYCREFGLYKSSLGLALKGFDSAVLARDSRAMTQALVLIGVGFTEIGRADAGHLVLLKALSRAEASRRVLDILRVHNGLLLAAVAIREARAAEPLTPPQTEILRLAVESARIVDEMSQPGSASSGFVRAALLTNAGKVMCSSGNFDKGLTDLRQAQSIAMDGGYRLLHLKALIGELHVLHQRSMALPLERLLNAISMARELKLSRLERSSLSLAMRVSDIDEALRRDFAQRIHELDARQGEEEAERLVNPYATHVDKILAAADPAALAHSHFSI